MERLGDHAALQRGTRKILASDQKVLPLGEIQI
jgi:hypothetical protein